MANRIMLNETSYHGAGAIQEIAAEAKARAFKKAFVCSDPDLIKFGVTGKVTDVLDKAGLAYEIYSDIKANPSKMYRMVLPHSKLPKQITLLQLAAVLLWIPQRQSVLSLQIRNLKT